jgi:hypothetical protein
LVRNERTKLTATYLNGVAIAFAALGAIAPWIAYAQGAATRLIVAGLSTVICVALSVSLHLVGRAMLGQLREP